jgi:hypothetical protein
MHYSVLVIGPDPEGQLARYDENLEVAPYVGVCWNCEGDAKWQPCDECKDTGKVETTRNPDGKWDYWQLGGSWANRLVLLDGKAASQALRGVIDLPATFDRLTVEEGVPGTYVLVCEGVWRERQSWSDEEDRFVPDPNYPALWRRMVEGLAPDVLLTVVDIHS